MEGATRLASLNGFEGLQELRAGGATELKLGGREGMPVGLAAAGLLRRSAATLTSVDFRSAACVCVSACGRARARVRVCAWSWVGQGAAWPPCRVSECRCM